jgi:hypothetical protein
MIGAARRWFRRNRKGLAIGAGVLGAGYLAGQYVLSKISEARERMSSDRIAREKYVSSTSLVVSHRWPVWLRLARELVTGSVLRARELTTRLLVCGDDSSRTRPIVPILSLRCFPLPRKILSKPSLLKS